MSQDPQFDMLIESLRIIHKTTDRKVIGALQELNNNPQNKPDISTINKWIKSTDPINDNYKVARCLVWYIAKIYLGNKDILPAEFPFCECSEDT